MSQRKFLRQIGDFNGLLGHFDNAWHFMTNPDAWRTHSLRWTDTRPWGLDNGAFEIRGFPADKLLDILRFLKQYPPKNLLFVAAPDSVRPRSAAITLKLWKEWEPRIHEAGLKAAYVLQDGQKFVEPPWDELDTLFVGGSDLFRASNTCLELVREAQKRRKWVHFGRANRLSYLTMALRMGMDSIDSMAFCYDRATLLRVIHIVQHYEQTGQIVNIQRLQTLINRTTSKRTVTRR